MDEIRRSRLRPEAQPSFNPRLFLTVATGTVLANTKVMRKGKEAAAEFEKIIGAADQYHAVGPSCTSGNAFVSH
jgi:hypothetical protein